MGVSLAGKAAFVTGGSRGIGKAICRALLKKKVKVCIADLDNKMGQRTRKELAYIYGKDNVMFAECDVTSQQSFEGSLLTAKEQLGGLQILVNNAGILNETDWKRTVEVNLKGVMRGTLLAIKHLTSKDGRRGGNVVNMASLLAFRTAPFLPVYSATQSAVASWSKCWGDEENFKKTGVRVIAICPDGVDTRLARSIPRKAVDKTLAKTAFAILEPDLLTTAEIARAFIKVLEDAATGLLLLVTHENGAYYVLDSASDNLAWPNDQVAERKKLMDQFKFWKTTNKTVS